MYVLQLLVGATGSKNIVAKDFRLTVDGPGIELLDRLSNAPEGKVSEFLLLCRNSEAYRLQR